MMLKVLKIKILYRPKHLVLYYQIMHLINFPIPNYLIKNTSDITIFPFKAFYTSTRVTAIILNNLLYLTTS